MPRFVRHPFAATAAWYLVSFAGGSAIGQVLQGEATGYDAAKGAALYSANCAACHLASGEGVPGAFPPLKGSGVVNKDDATKHIHAVLDGMQGGKAGRGVPEHDAAIRGCAKR